MAKHWSAGVTKNRRALKRKAKTTGGITKQETVSKSFSDKVAQSFNPVLEECDLIKEVYPMSCCDLQEECNYQIDYSEITIGERIIPFKFELDLALSVLDPPPGQNQRYIYRVTGVGENISTYQSLSHWVLSINPDISLSQITNVQVIIGGVPQPVIIGANVVLFVPPDIDAATGCAGLKFDFSLSKILNAPDSAGLFGFELTTPYPLGALTVGVTSRQVNSSALCICGPAWSK